MLFMNSYSTTLIGLVATWMLCSTKNASGQSVGGCRPIYVRWSRVKLAFRPKVEGPYAMTDCRHACTNGEHPARAGYPLECAGFNHKQGPSEYQHDCQIYQANQLQSVDGNAEADDRYSFYWKYCVKTSKNCPSDYQFTFHSDRYMDRSEVARLVFTTTLEDCLSKCLDEPMFTCRSVSFNRTDGGCHMSPQNTLSKPRFFRLNNNPNFRIDYYESNCYNNSFTFKHECRDDGMVVRVESKFAYTGALYGLYDYFTCRLEPHEQHNFSLFFPSPTLSKNCSDSIRFRGDHMILEVVLSTDGIQPLYFITPEDLTYQAKCPIVNQHSVGASIDLVPITSKRRSGTDADRGDTTANRKAPPASAALRYRPPKDTFQLPWIDPRGDADDRLSEGIYDGLRNGTRISVIVGRSDSSSRDRARGITVVGNPDVHGLAIDRVGGRYSSRFTSTITASSTSTQRSPSDSSDRVFAAHSPNSSQKRQKPPTAIRVTVRSRPSTPEGTISSTVGRDITSTKLTSSRRPSTLVGTIFTKSVLPTKATTAQRNDGTQAAISKTSPADFVRAETTLSRPTKESATFRTTTNSTSIPTTTDRAAFRQTTRTSAPRWTVASPTTNAQTPSYIPALPPKLFAVEQRTSTTTADPTTTRRTTTTTTSTTTTTQRPTTTTASTTTTRGVQPTTSTTTTTTRPPPSSTTTPTTTTTTTTPPQPILFDIFNGGQPVEAVVVGSRITLSFTPFYAIPSSYMTIVGCQIEPVGSLYEWEKEPLPIVKDGCQADNVGLVCPPERTDFGMRVRVESFRYQTTAEVQYSCLVRVCPFSPCPQTYCAQVEGCSPPTTEQLLRQSRLRATSRRSRTKRQQARTKRQQLRTKRQLTLAQLQQALIQNPDLQRQLNLLNRGAAFAAPNAAATSVESRPPAQWQQYLVSLGGEHVIKKRLIVVNSDHELQYYLRTGNVPRTGGGVSRWGR